MLRRIALPGLAALALGGCNLGPIRERDVSLAEMPCSGIDVASGAWVSAPFPVAPDVEDMGDGGTSGSCGWMIFERRERLVIEHDLGRTPSVVLVYVAFNPSGTGATIASGDVLRIMAVDDATVSIENRTDQAFYMRLVLE